MISSQQEPFLYNHKDTSQPILHPGSWIRIGNVYKMSYFPLSVHVLQKLYLFLVLPLLCGKEKFWKSQKLFAEDWFFHPSLTSEVGFWLFLWNVSWNSSKNNRKEGTDFWELIAPPLRDLRRLGDTEVTAIQWGCRVLIGKKDCHACPVLKGMLVCWGSYP